MIGKYDIRVEYTSEYRSQVSRSESHNHHPISLFPIRIYRLVYIQISSLPLGCCGVQRQLLQAVPRRPGGRVAAVQHAVRRVRAPAVRAECGAARGPRGHAVRHRGTRLHLCAPARAAASAVLAICHRHQHPDPVVAIVVPQWPNPNPDTDTISNTSRSLCCVRRVGQQR